MKAGGRGFTLIELIVVIAILSILVAIAIPKYVDLTTQAKKAADDGTLGGLRACTMMLYASNVVDGVTNAFGTYWPTEAQVTNNMSEAYAWRYYTTHTYSPTTGVWTVSP